MLVKNYMLAAILVLFAGCAHSLPEQIRTPSLLNSNPTTYDNKRVVVRGYVVLKPESHVLYESKQLNMELQRRWGDADFDPKDYNKYCLTVANPDFLFDHKSFFAGKTIIVEGTFLAEYLKSDEIDLGACALPTGILIDEEKLRQRYHL